MAARRKLTTSAAMPCAVTKLARRASQRKTILTPGYSSCRFLASVEDRTISPMNLVWIIRIERKGLGEICNIFFSAPGGLGGREIGKKRCRDCVLGRAHQREFAYKIVSLAPNGHPRVAVSSIPKGLCRNQDAAALFLGRGTAVLAICTAAWAAANLAIGTR